MFATLLPYLDATMDQATEDVAPAWGVLPVEQYLLVHEITPSYSFSSFPGKNLCIARSPTYNPP